MFQMFQIKSPAGTGGIMPPESLEGFESENIRAAKRYWQPLNSETRITALWSCASVHLSSCSSDPFGYQMS